MSRYNVCDLLSEELNRLHVAAENARECSDYDSEHKYIERIGHVYELVNRLIDKSEVEVEVPSSDIDVPAFTPEQLAKLGPEVQEMLMGSGINIEVNNTSESKQTRVTTAVPSFPGDE